MKKIIIFIILLVGPGIFIYTQLINNQNRDSSIQTAGSPIYTKGSISKGDMPQDTNNIKNTTHIYRNDKYGFEIHFPENMKDITPIETSEDYTVTQKKSPDNEKWWRVSFYLPTKENYSYGTSKSHPGLVEIFGINIIERNYFLKNISCSSKNASMGCKNEQDIKWSNNYGFEFFDNGGILDENLPNDVADRLIGNGIITKAQDPVRGYITIGRPGMYLLERFHIIP